MNSLIGSRFVLCGLALGFMFNIVLETHAAHSKLDLYRGATDHAWPTMSLSEVEDEEDYGGGEKSPESKEKDVTPGPKNVILFFARFPAVSDPARKKNVDATANSTAVSYASFPVQASVGVTPTGSQSSDSSINLVALSGKYRRQVASTSSDNSCKVALDASVAKLLEWARNTELMATGVVANGKRSQEMSLTQVHRDSSGGNGFATKHEYMKEARNDVKRQGKRAQRRDAAWAVDTVAVRKRTTDELGQEPPNVEMYSVDPFKAIDVFKRYVFHNFFNFIGFDLADNLDSDLKEMGMKPIKPGKELVRGMLKGLQREAGEKGYLLVVSAGELEDLNDAVTLVKDRTDPATTLIAVTGQCPGDDTLDTGLNGLSLDKLFGIPRGGNVHRRSVEVKKAQVPLYATGPKSDVLGKVDLLWEIPTEIQNILKDDNKRSSRSTVNPSTWRQQFQEIKENNANDNGLVRKSFLKSAGVGDKRDDTDTDFDDRFDKLLGGMEHFTDGPAMIKDGRNTGKRGRFEDFNEEDEAEISVGQGAKKAVSTENVDGDDEVEDNRSGRRTKKRVVLEDFGADDGAVSTGRHRVKKGVVIKDFSGGDGKSVRRPKRGVEKEDDVRVEGSGGQMTKKGPLAEESPDGGSSLRASAVVMTICFTVVAVCINSVLVY